MGKKKSVGKSRQDKYYHLAKETGFRARSAFKLLQLNKKFNFLQSSKVLVDLCAAPGGWLQVASEHMPMSSLIVGVDLVPIRPIPRCITFQDDITKDSCRSQLKRELHQWQVDCFLNDGAPNVGKNWLHDAYTQSVLTLHALKLSCNFLRKGGWFVTKVFRSKDYQALMWVFGQLFNKVHATKPQASRNVSAEIFVVCQGYKSPDKIDKKFFDPASVFEEVEGKAKAVRLLDFQEIKKKKALGYEDGNKGLLFVRKTVTEFLECSHPLEFLKQVNELVFENETQKKDPLLTEEMIENIKDIRCMSRKAISVLLKWHKKTKKLNAPVENEEDKEEAKEEDSDEEIEKQLQEIQETEAKLLKKKKKTVLKEKHKLRERMGHMAQSVDTQEDMELFALKKIKSTSQLMEVADAEAPTLYSGSEESGNESDDHSEEEEDSDQEEEESDEEIYTFEQDVDSNPLIASLGAEAMESKLWFDKEIFKDIEEEEDEIAEMKQAEKYYEEKRKDIKTKKKALKAKAKSKPKEEEMEEEKTEVQERLEMYDSGSDSDDSDYDIEERMGLPSSGGPKGKVVEMDKLDADGLALATVIATSRKKKRDIIDESFNRFTFNEDDGDLPDWFVDDEKLRAGRRPEYLDKHTPKALLRFYRGKGVKINVRTIKKVAEAKARKKRRMNNKMQKVKKQAEGIVDSQEMSNREKSAHIKGIYKKAGILGKPKENTTYLIGRRGVGKRVSRPPGVKGKFKVVDNRMKKDLRANKSTKNQKGKGKPSRSSGKGKKK